MDGLAFIGVGEAGQAVAGRVARAGAGGVSAVDLRPLGAEMAACGVTAGADRAAALAGAGLVWYLVTADRAAAAARECAPVLPPGALWLDGNSGSPGARARVEGRVLASLQASDPGLDWPSRAACNLERMAVHGIRRAAGMREVVATLAELGLPDRMAAATAARQAQIGAPGVAMEPGLGPRADALLTALGA